MKSSLQQKEVLLSATSEGKNNLQVKENNHLFNHIGKLAADHDVTVSNTMIKVTYKKALKDQNSVDGVVDSNSESDFPNGRSKPNETANLCNSDISFIVKSPKLQAVGHKVFHSTPKPVATNTEKTKKYVNGINLLGTPNSLVGTSSAAKVQKTSSSQGESSSSPKKSKAISNKQTSKLELDKTFLKDNGLVKPKTSIIQRSGGDGKKMKLSKGSDKKIKKLENGVKNKVGMDKKGTAMKGTKRQASNTEFNLVKYKKMKMNDNKTKHKEGSGSVEEVNKSGSKKKIMLVDPDLPTGWTRFIRTKNKGLPNEQYVVYVVNPQGKKFRFKWKLRKYLQRTNSSLDVDQFFFGLYQRPKTSNVSATEREEKTRMSATTVTREGSPDDLDNVASEHSSGYYESSNSKNRNPDGKEIRFSDRDLPFELKRIVLVAPTEENTSLVYKTEEGSTVMYNKSINSGSEEGIHEFTGDSKMELPNSPMYDDPNLPEGWKRFIKIRSCGDSAGRMEVVLVSPDGRTIRSRKHLEHYLKQKQLTYKSEDFDFSVFGRSRQFPSESEQHGEGKQEQGSNDVTFLGMKKKFTDKPVPELDINSLKEPVVSPEGRLINSVTGLMLSSGLSTSRNERRQRLPRREHEKQLKSYLSTETEPSFDGCQIPAGWVQRLVKCRGDFRILEVDAATTLAETTKEFIKKVSLQALTNSEQPENGLKYDDIAEVVDGTKGLSFLKTLIPKKITFREYVKLNRPKQFMSFT